MQGMEHVQTHERACGLQSGGGVACAQRCARVLLVAVAPGSPRHKSQPAPSIHLCIPPSFLLLPSTPQSGPMEVMDVLAERISTEHSRLPGANTTRSK